MALFLLLVPFGANAPRLFLVFLGVEPKGIYSRGLRLRHLFAPVFLLLFSSIAFAQTFTVLNETTGTSSIDTLDGTTEFRYSVRLNGVAGTLTGVVPQLVPPACAQQGGQSIFNTTYMGILGGSSTDLAIPAWSNNETRTLVFRVHLYNNSVTCGGTSSCGSNNYAFQLRFTHSGTSNPISAVDPSNHLRVNGPQSDGFKVVHVVSETKPADCKYYPGNGFLFVDYNEIPSSLRNDPEVRVFLGINWNLNINNASPPLTFPLGVTNFIYPIAFGQNQSFRLQNPSSHLPVVDMIQPGTEILDLNNQPFSLGILGGTGPYVPFGPCTTQNTWNFFDISNQRPETQAPPPLINHLQNPKNGAFENPLTFNPGTRGLDFRKAGLYLVKPAGCDQSTAFGTPPTQIQFQNYDMLSSNAADVRLSLPSSWTTSGGSQLRSNYTIEWFYRNNGTLKKATRVGGGATPARALNTTLNIPFTNPSDFVIEARIRRVGSNAIISFQSPGHNLNYSQLDMRAFENAEFNPANNANQPDEYWDVGETLAQELVIQNTGGFANDVTVTIGKVGSNTADIAYSSREKSTVFAGINTSQQVLQRDIAVNGSVDVDLLYELLRYENTCSSLSLFYEVSYRNQGMETSYRQEFSLPANCDIRENTFSLDGSWTPAENFGTPPCNGSNCNGSSISTQSPTTGWGYTNPNWVGSTASNSRFYTLTSTAAGFPNGTDDRISMAHQATFTPLDAGGVVEYRTSNGGSWSPWQDLIQPIENQNGNPLYNNQTFTTTTPGRDNVIGGRKVFMDMSSQQSFDLPVSDATLSGSRVQFRFLYHLVSGASSAGLWQILDFKYKTKLAQFDDVFGLGENLAFNRCFPTIELEPAHSGSYTYSWYTSFQNLVDDLPHSVSSDGSWDFPMPASAADYYVRVQLDNPGTARYYKLRVEEGVGVPPFEDLIRDWRTSGSAMTDIDKSGVVNVLDFVIQVNLDNCR